MTVIQRIGQLQEMCNGNIKAKGRRGLQNLSLDWYVVYWYCRQFCYLIIIRQHAFVCACVELIVSVVVSDF